MELAEKSARAYAKRQHKNKNLQFVDECIAEANYWLVIVFSELKERLFEDKNTVAFIRSKIAYKLKEYWAPYSTSTMSYTKAKGETLPDFVDIETVEVSGKNTDEDIERFICLETVMTSQLDWNIYEQKLTGSTAEEIALELKIKVRLVRRTLAKIKKRLKVCNSEEL